MMRRNVAFLGTAVVVVSAVVNVAHTALAGDSEEGRIPRMEVHE